MDEILRELQTLNERVSALEASSSSSSPLPSVEREVREEKGSSLTSPAGNPVGLLLGYTSGLVFLLAAGYLFRMTLWGDWLTPPWKVGFTTLCGGALLVGGWMQDSSRSRSLGGLLGGLGAALLNFSCWGAYFFYGMLTDPQVLFATSLIGLGSLGLYVSRRLSVYNVMAILGVYGGLLLVDPPLSMTATYLLFWGSLFTFSALYWKNRVALILSSYCGVVLYRLFSLQPFFSQDWEEGLLAKLLGLESGIPVLVLILILGGGMVAYRWMHQAPLSKKEGWCLVPLILFWYLFLGEREHSYPWLLGESSLLLFTLSIGGWIYALRKVGVAQDRESESPAVFVVLAIFLLYFKALYLTSLQWAGVGVGAAFLLPLFLWTFSPPKEFKASLLIFGVGIASSFCFLVEKAFSEQDVFELACLSGAMGWALLGNSLFLFIAKGKKNHLPMGDTALLGGALVAMVIQGLIATLHGFDVLWSTEGVAREELFFLLPLAHSSTGVVLLLIARRVGYHLLAYSSLPFFVYAVSDVLWHDWGGNHSFWPIGAFLWVGGVLFWAGRVFSQMRHWQQGPQADEGALKEG